MFDARRASVSPGRVASNPIRDSSCCVAPASRGLTLRAPLPRSAPADRAWSLPWVHSTRGASVRSAARLSRRSRTGSNAQPCGYAGYANAVPGAEAVCFDERGQVLLGRRAFDPGKGLWDLPGGLLHEDEHPLDALQREIREETALEI